MLEPLHVGSQTEATALLAKLSAMQLRKELKIIRGSFSETILHVEFRLKATGEIWLLRGVNDIRGGLTLERS